MAQSLTPPPELPKELVDDKLSTKKEIRLVGQDIRYIHEKLKPPSRVWNFLFYLMLVIDIGLTLASLAVIAVQRREEFFSANIALKRELRAKRSAQKMVRHLTLLAKREGAKNPQAFFNEAERLMNQYLADKLNLSPSSLTQEILSQRLSGRGASQEAIQKVKRFYEVSGLVRFGRAEVFGLRANEILDSIRQILKEEF